METASARRFGKGNVMTGNVMTNELALAGERAIETPASGPRSIQEITASAVRYQTEGADAVIGLGNCLIEAFQPNPPNNGRDKRGVQS